MIDLTHVPDYLKDHGRFCLWKKETRKKAGGGTYVTKVPVDPHTGRNGDSTDPSKFADLDGASAHVDEFDGLGVGIFGDVAGVDIDHCVTDGKLSELATSVVEMLGGGYMEFSPSGDGIHVLLLAPGMAERYTREEYEARYKKNNRAIGLEIYISGTTDRFLTLTGRGRVYGDFEQDRTEQIQAVLDEYMAKPEEDLRPKERRNVTPLDMTDEALIAIACGDQPLDSGAYAANGDKFKSLWEGRLDGYGSPSEAVAALLMMLAFWTQEDEARMDTLFRNSGLYRIEHVAEKWDSKRGATTWGAKEVQKAAAKNRDVYNPPAADGFYDFDDYATAAPGASATKAGSGEGNGDGRADNDGTETSVATTDNGEDEATEKEPPKTSRELFEEFAQRIRTEAYKPLKTGMTAFDNLLSGGIMRQSLVVVTAAPGTGKTALMSQIAEQMAKDGQDVVFLNLEMSREYILARSISRIMAGYDYPMTATKILRGYAWTDEERGYVEAAMNSYANTTADHMHYNPDGCTSDLGSIVATLARYGEQAKRDGKMAPPVVLDYLHLVTTKKRQDPQEIVKQTISVMKEYAIRYNTFAIVISATNRKSNETGKQTQSSGRDSSAIEYTADVQLTLNYAALADREKRLDPITNKERAYSANNPDDMAELMREKPRRMVVQVVKERMGPGGGKLYLDFDAAHSKFTPGKPKYKRG